jgi:hypothetical protein
MSQDIGMAGPLSVTAMAGPSKQRCVQLTLPSGCDYVVLSREHAAKLRDIIESWLATFGQPI